MDGIAEIGQVVGPLGVLVVVVAWALISRRQNGRSDRYRVLVTKLDALREDIGEVKTDVREHRSSVVRHLEDHANS